MEIFKVKFGTLSFRKKNFASCPEIVLRVSVFNHPIHPGQQQIELYFDYRKYLLWRSKAVSNFDLSDAQEVTRSWSSIEEEARRKEFIFGKSDQTREIEVRGEEESLVGLQEREVREEGAVADTEDSPGLQERALRNKISDVVSDIEDSFGLNERGFREEISDAVADKENSFGLSNELLEAVADTDNSLGFSNEISEVVADKENSLGLSNEISDIVADTENSLGFHEKGSWKECALADTEKSSPHSDTERDKIEEESIDRYVGTEESSGRPLIALSERAPPVELGRKEREVSTCMDKE